VKVRLQEKLTVRVISLTVYYRFVVLFFNCLLTFGSYFCFDIPSVLQDQFQGVSETISLILIDNNANHWLLPHPAEPDMFQCNRHQRHRGLCAGPGDEPSAVQSPLRHLCVDVSADASPGGRRRLLTTRLQLLCSPVNRNAVVVIMAGFLIDKLGNRCKSTQTHGYLSRDVW